MIKHSMFETRKLQLGNSVICEICGEEIKRDIFYDIYGNKFEAKNNTGTYDDPLYEEIEIKRKQLCQNCYDKNF